MLCLVMCCPAVYFFFFLMIRRPPRSTLFPTRRSSDLTKHSANGELAGSEPSLGTLGRNRCHRLRRQGLLSSRRRAAKRQSRRWCCVVRRRYAATSPKEPGDRVPDSTTCCAGFGARQLFCSDRTQN